MTRNIDELNNLTTQKAEPPEQYFKKMDLDDEQVEKRLEYTKKANELFDVILILLLTMNENGDTNFFYARDLLESWILSLVAEYTTPDDYLIDYVADTAYNFIETTNKHIEEPWYTSSDRALYNAENGANDVLNYTEYKEAIEAGKTHKRWITENDNRVRNTHKAVTKKPIPIKDYFWVGAAQMRFPKDYELAEAFPEELINCRCTIKYLPNNDKKNEENVKSKQNRIENNYNNSIIKENKLAEIDFDKNYEADRKVRTEYNKAVSNISSEYDPNKDLEEQAYERFLERNTLKDIARNEMTDPKEVEFLNINFPKKSFEDLIASKMKRKNMTREEALKDIIKTASKTNSDFNKEYGI